MHIALHGNIAEQIEFYFLFVKIQSRKQNRYNITFSGNNLSNL